MEEEYLFTGSLYPIRNNGNPGEFDYAGFMAGKNCYFRFYVDSIFPAGSYARGDHIIRKMASQVKSRLTSEWTGSEEELSILMAVILGDKSGLSSELKQYYKEAGAMHILAVSGLHVGLIWMVLSKMFFFLVRLPGGKAIRSIVVILILWFYATMTGLSPSVCRSVTMFSLLSFSSFLSRRSGSLNIVFFSAFILF